MKLKSLIKEINYIIAFYNGNRRQYGYKTYWKTFLDSHIDFIKNNMVEIGLVTFIISGSSDNNLSKDDKEMVKYLLSLDLPFNFEIHTRVNNEYSYGGFKEVIKKNYRDYKYSFIIEDDYIPTHPNFMEYFLKKFKDQVIYVPSLHENCKNLGSKGDSPFISQYHAAICNGMINNKFINNNINLLMGDVDSTFDGYGYLDQIQFMQKYKEIGYTFDDITDIAHTEFFDINRGMIKYGDITKPLIIKPILV